MSEDIILPVALLLDMDGTITEPMLDFPRIKAEMGIGSRPILEAMAEMLPAERAQAQAVLERHEEAAARLSVLNTGCRELFGWLESWRIPVALVTRNSPASVRTVMERHGLRAEVLITRDDAPPKPHPRPLLLACERLGMPPQSAWMVGDGAFDVQAGEAAGMRTVWISHGRSVFFSPEPWRNLASLNDLLNLLMKCATRRPFDELLRTVRV